jgi:putative tryptophan/tyrosine transport system substrate-binding protein
MTTQHLSPLTMLLSRHTRRREFITLLGGAVGAWPLAARAQQPAMPVVGYLVPGVFGQNLALVRRALAEAGYVEGRNLTIEYRFAEGQYERLPELAAELVQRQTAVIIAVTSPAALAAKAATATIPIVFNTPDDPVGIGLVASLARPGGNATGVHQFNSGLGAKQLGLLHELVPSASRVGLLLNPNNSNVDVMTREVTAAATTIGVEIGVVRARDRREIEVAFATLVRNRADALVVGADSFFFGRRLQLATLATRHGIPAIYNAREYPEAGGLMSYGASLTEVFRYLAVYATRILKGDKPSALPVVQSTKLDFVINIPTARALGLEVPPMLLASADEVIE